ncbi:UDP-N-acetylmuramoyl-L-alanyl-D-glutamate--2,6-diaminopimelate ligase [candidate division WOR-3 bacterium]|uniref:UDP-N-acetylmuramoyl-L-alanyl-D-glutamate--2,6-diaminopimelate ligase n=1 Tax=candidate division WOR-3 bacterium TaxID=2052148 RepID=A0A938BTY4_UNCW3|nr:UDP-N-acetylmuramoyl-L-alanyl-D-glutamate--2,6-diaminopimelate ligase [candidate division WOR-3 bacterium]
MKRIGDLTKGVPCTVLGNSALEVKGIAYHSAAVKPGYLFVAIEGFRVSGQQYIDEAVNRGALAVATTDVNSVHKSWVTVVQTKIPRRFLAQVANRFYDFPARKLSLVGITGTNGKTTTAYLVRSMARQAGIEPGFVGTIEYFDGGDTVRAGQTTPESLDFVQLLARLAEKQIPLCIAEVSSHSLALDRVFDLDFKVGTFTNLTQDHLDFHRTLDAYREAKMRLFTALIPSATAVTNLDDAMGRDVPHQTKSRVITYGTRPDLEPAPGIWGKVTGVRPDGLDCEVNVDARTWPVRLKLIGRHNLSNLLAAVGTGKALGWTPELMAAGAETLAAVPGRLEPVDAGQPFRVYVDFAHTPDALRRVLSTVREFTAGRVIVVFGCGGDRDRGKRPLMGEAAVQLADAALVTSDNPRGERPQAIIDEILRGMGSAAKAVESDRKEAIRRALIEAKPGDAVVIAGKGHEDYQIVGTERKHFDDRETARELLQEMV